MMLQFVYVHYLNIAKKKIDKKIINVAGSSPKKQNYGSDRKVGNCISLKMKIMKLLNYNIFGGKQACTEVWYPPKLID